MENIGTLKAALAHAKQMAIQAKMDYQKELDALDARRAELTAAIAEINSELGIAVAPVSAPKTRKLGDMASRILGVMQTGTVYTPSEIAAALKEESTYLGVPLRQLQDKGFVRKIDRGQYERLAGAPSEEAHAEAPATVEVTEAPDAMAVEV